MPAKKGVEGLVVACLLIIGLGLSVAQKSMPAARNAQAAAFVGQLYFYSVHDRPSFEEGYRRHLEWHSGHKDQLVWYAWTIESGARKGVFVDGTLGTTFAGLDARPDPNGDGSDFVRNVAPHVTALDIETWSLWAQPSTATPLEEHHPGKMLDIFFLQVDPAEAASFEAAVEGLAKTKREGPRLSWYAVVRGDNLPTYVLLLTRENLTDIESAGLTLGGMLSRTYATTPGQLAEVLRYVRRVHTETWRYEPRLALLPGHPLEP